MLDERCHVVEHTGIGGGYRLLVIDAPAIASSVSPGQFVHVRVPGLEESALRRPFSVFDADGGKVHVLYKTVGRGTSALNCAKAGEPLCVEGPLGRGFPDTANVSPGYRAACSAIHLRFFLRDRLPSVK